MSKQTVCAIVAVLFGALAAPASALGIGPGQGIAAPFSLTRPASGANTLTFNLVSVAAVGVTTMTVELYDGASLLASVSGVPIAGVAAFVDAGSLWATNAVAADLSSLRDGTIDGLILVLPDFTGAGALNAQVSPATSFAVGSGTAPATIVAIAGVLSVGEEFAVPEPSAALLLAGAAVLHARRRRR
jgi:hypothetical protein